MFLTAVLLSHHSYNLVTICTSRILYQLLLKPIHAICAVHYILLTSSFLTIRDKEYKQRRLSLRNLTGFSEIHVYVSVHKWTKNMNRLN